MENPLRIPDWLLVGVGAAVVGGIGYAIYTTYVNASWPPSADVQQGILNQILAINLAMGGMQPTAAQSTELAASVAELPAIYVAALPAGTTPTVAGYQAWSSANITGYVASGGAAGGYSNQIDQQAQS
jgi:hypothetical protein